MTITTATTASAPTFPPDEAVYLTDELLRPIDPIHHRQLKKGGVTITYVPWCRIALHLHKRLPGQWEWVLDEVKEIGDFVSVRGTLILHNNLNHTTRSFSGVASERLVTKGAPPIEVAASSALRRAAGAAGLGLHLWDVD